MLSLLTPENLPAVLTAIGTLIAAVGGVTLYKVHKEPPKIGTPDAAAMLLADNTKALLDMAEKMAGQNSQFDNNNKMFAEVIHHVADMAKDFAEARKEMTLAREHLAALREQGNRRTR